MVRKRELSLKRALRARQVSVRPKKLKPILLRRLRVARQANELTWQQLAEAAGVTHAIFSRLQSARGPTRRVRTSTLNRLANALRVSPEWLTGERPDLPYVSEWDLTRRKGEGPSRWEQPTPDDLRWSWLMQHAEEAIRRDLVEWYGQETGEEVYTSWGHHLLSAFPRLAASMVWRSVALRPSSNGSSSDLWQVDEAPSDRWLAHMLEPWFAGRAYLNAQRLRGILEAVLTEPSVQLLGSDTTDQDAVRALDLYGSKCDEIERERFDTAGDD